MYYSDKDDYEVDFSNSAKFPKKKFSRKFDQREKEKKEDDNSYSRSQQEDSFDFSVVSKKQVAQEFIELKNIVKNSVENVNDILNCKVLRKIDKFEIINEEKEDEYRNQAKELNIQKHKDSCGYSTNYQSNYYSSGNNNVNNSLNSNVNLSMLTSSLNTNTSIQNNSVNKDPLSKTRNLSSHKKFDILNSTKSKIKKDVVESKKNVCNVQSTNTNKQNTKPTSKSDLFESGGGMYKTHESTKKQQKKILNNIVQQEKKKFIKKITALNNTSITSSNITNLNSLITTKRNSDNNNKDRNKSSKINNDTFKSKVVNSTTNKNKNSSPLKKTKKSSLTSRNSKEKFVNEKGVTNSSNNEKTQNIFNMIKLYMDFSNYKSGLKDINSKIGSNILNSNLIFLGRTYNSSIITTYEVKVMRIQKAWRFYKMKKLTGKKCNKQYLNMYLKYSIYKDLDKSECLSRFNSLINSALDCYEQLLASNGNYFNLEHIKNLSIFEEINEVVCKKSETNKSKQAKKAEINQIISNENFYRNIISKKLKENKHREEIINSVKYTKSETDSFNTSFSRNVISSEFKQLSISRNDNPPTKSPQVSNAIANSLNKGNIKITRKIYK